MSVILRQGLKYSIVGYLGFLLGTLANFFIFPNDLEFYGPNGGDVRPDSGFWDFFF